MPMDRHAPSAGGEQAPICAPEHRLAILLSAILASSMGFIDSSVTAIAVPAMRASLDASLVSAQWFSGAYLLALSALILAGGAMGDRFGVGRVFLGGILLFALASLTCIWAASPGQLIAARALQGVAAAAMVPGSMAIIARAYPRAERGRALGLWAAAATATTAAGPILGGALLTWGGPEAWRLIFALNLPLAAVAAGLLLAYARHDPGQPGLPVDLPGAGMATLGLGLVAYALTDGAGLYAAAGAVVLLAFLWWEMRAAHPMIRLAQFRNRAFAAANLATFFLYFALTAVMFYLPMTVISGWGLPAIEVTAAFLPISILIAALSGMAGRLADRFGPGPLMALGSGLVALAYGGLALTAAEADFWGRVVPFMVLAGAGLGLVVAPLTVAVMAAASDAEQGAASGINNAVARVASLVGVALMGRVAASAYGEGLPGFGLAGAGPAHLAQTSHAFAVVAAISAALALVSAVISAIGLPPRRP